MLSASKPVVSVCAVRTGCGKSQTSREAARVLRGLGKKTVTVRHPMPYGDLTRQVAQRFATLADLDAADCTIEEREEYEPVIRAGGVVYAGIDYEQILRQAEAEADVIVWDGGNNDTPFFKPDLHIVVFDPRPYLAGSLKQTFQRYPQIGPLLPAMGYSHAQVRDLEATIAATPCDLVISATPVDLSALMRIEKPTLRVGYAYADHGRPTLEELIVARFQPKGD
jgi:predicted GTPase